MVVSTIRIPGIAAGKFRIPTVKVAILRSILDKLSPPKNKPLVASLLPILEVLTRQPPHVLIAEQRLQSLSPPLIVHLLLQLIAVPAGSSTESDEQETQSDDLQHLGGQEGLSRMMFGSQNSREFIPENYIKKM